MILSIVLVSCGDKQKFKVAYLYPDADRARFVKEGNFIIERLNQLGAKTLMVDANDDEATQLSKGMKLIDDGIDLLILASVNGNTIAPLVRYAKENNVPVIGYNRLISNVEYDLFITGDNINNAEIFCQSALAQKPQGNYVILAGDRFDRNGLELKLAIDSILKPHVEKGDINIIYESYIEGWNKEVAEMEFGDVVEAWGTNIDAVIACSDPMAAGTVAVLRKHNIGGQVFVTGQDAEIQAVKDIIEGFQNITIYHPHKVLGYKTAEVAMDILNGKRVNKIANSKTFNGLTLIPTLQIKSIPVTIDNYQKELIESGEYSMSELN